MIRKLLIAVLPLAALFSLTSLMMSDDGRAGRTGSPGELTCLDCHDDFALNGGGGSISIQSPGMTGFEYTPGQTYSMSVTVARSANSLFGVGIEALTSTNINGGTLIITDAASTQIKNVTVSGVSRRNVVHQLNGGANPASKVFNFNWTAPATGTGNISFYFAGVAANANGQNSGDYVYASSQVFTEAACAGPAQPGTISGQATICSGGSTTYSIAAVPAATSYTWTLPGGWSGTSTTTSINVTAGATSGNISVKANNGCGSSTPSSLAVSSSVITASMTQTNVSCNGGNNGTATVTPSGGAGPYTYSWSPTGGTLAVASNLSQGTYTVTITDAQSCTKTSSVTITQPAVVTGSTTVTNISCNGGSNGSTTAFPAGGTSPYTYSWSPFGGTLATASGLTPGGYTVTITDSKGCTGTASSTITQPAVLSGTASSTNVSCNGGNNGSATAIPTGGTAPYTYQWTPSGGNSVTANNLIAGNYSVTITDSKGCTKTASASITQPVVISATQTQNNVSCNGAATGSASVTVSGGFSPYHYSWLPSGGTSAAASNLLAGNYSVVVTDNSSCSKTFPFSISQPTAITINTTTTDANCSSATGSATASASGGTGALTYSWSTNPVQNTSTATNLSAGNFTVTVTDASGCTKTKTATINQNSTLVVTTNSLMVHCHGESNGMAIVIPSGGSPGYTCVWNTIPAQINDTAFNLPAGVYSATVSDVAGCSFSTNVNVTEPNPVVASAGVDESFCEGGSKLIGGSPSGSGGTAPYTYSWLPSTGLSSDTASNPLSTPSANTSYTLTTSDANNCTANSVVSLTLNPLPAPIIYNMVDTLLTIQGISFYWYLDNNLIDSTTVPIYIAPQNGNYTVTVTDSLGCSGTSPVFNMTAVGINSLNNENDFNIFPNPVLQYLTVNVSETFRNSHLTIFDFSGRVIKEMQLSNERSIIDFSEYAQGFYSIMLLNGNYRVIKRILK